jgi:hypothetical protein
LTSAKSFLTRFVGIWEGDGISEGNPVRDRMAVNWALDQRFLRFTYQAISGDSYMGEGYFWHNSDQCRYEWWEFNNGGWPIRQHSGERRDEQLVLNERAKNRDMRLTFSFTGMDTLEMQEGYLRKGEVFNLYAKVTLHRLSG